MNPVIAEVIGISLALAGTILAFVFITPEKKRNSLPKFFRMVADVFNFKQLLIEKILKALYIYSTLATILIGFFMLFSGYSSYDNAYSSYFGGLAGGFRSMAGYGFLLMIVGPFIVRLVYEGLMMFVLLVKNTIEINKKMGGTPAKDAPKPSTAQASNPARPVAPVYEPRYLFCTQCGTKYDANQGGCPNHCIEKSE